MEKALTPIQELIEFIRNDVFNESISGRKNEFKILSKAKELLEREKFVIATSYHNGRLAVHQNVRETGQEYYDRFYKLNQDEPKKEVFIILSYKENGEFVGYLSAFSANGGLQFAPQSLQAYEFDKKEDCIFADYQIWEEGRGGGKGFYRIEKTIPHKVEKNDFKVPAFVLSGKNINKND